MIKAISEYMRTAVLKSSGWFPFLDDNATQPIFIQVRPSCFPTCYEFIWTRNALIYLSQVCCLFSLSRRPVYKHAIMAFYSSCVLANCCVWLTSQSLSRQVAGYVLFFCRSKQHEVLETGNFPPQIEQPAEVSEPQKLYCLLGKRGGGEGGDGEWGKTNETERWK